MSKTKSGLLLIGVGVGMNVIGQVLGSQDWLFASPSLVSARNPLLGLTVLLMVTSLVVGLFGVFRLIASLMSRKKKAPDAGIAPPAQGVWPPAPKMPNEEKEN